MAVPRGIPAAAERPRRRELARWLGSDPRDTQLHHAPLARGPWTAAAPVSDRSKPLPEWIMRTSQDVERALWLLRLSYLLCCGDFGSQHASGTFHVGENLCSASMTPSVGGE